MSCSWQFPVLKVVCNVGPYASAILRFQIRFPPTYPDLPPVVTFTTDIFHPLIVPLTTYTFTTGSSETDTVSATDEERLSPGGFSLRHGFPHWFGRAKRGVAPSVLSVRSTSGNDAKSVKDETGVGVVSEDQASTYPGGRGHNSVSSPQSSRPSTAVESRGVISPLPGTVVVHDADSKADVSVLSLLNYIQSAFDDETVLDSIPFEAAGNPSAWHAWRSHRKTSDMCSDRSGALSPESAKSRRNNPQARLPGEWNWEGVWAKRSQNGVQTSYLESVLFGTSGRGTGDELVSLPSTMAGWMSNMTCRSGFPSLITNSSRS